MVKHLIQFIHHNKLLKDKTKILLGISGGIDSMVMADLFRKSEIDFAFAHCNFLLRDDESDADELVVREFAKKYKIEYFVEQMNTREFARENRVSTQMAARELRIQFFEKLCQNQNFQSFATAHHQDDAIETFFINLLRGTGISGLRGILPRQGISIHPMLFTNRDEIARYAQENHVKFREDSSNAKTDYTRNKIRHQLLPVINSINPAFNKIMTGNLNRLYLTEQVYKQKVKEILDRLIVQSHNQILIRKADIEELDFPEIYLYEALEKFGFNYSDVIQIIEGINGQSGKQFYSHSHRLVSDRAHLIITLLPDNNEEMMSISLTKRDSQITQPFEMNIHHFSRTTDFVPESNPQIAYLDADRLTFPLIIRKWKIGDAFKPLGMKGRKLLSDFFTDLKLSIPEKEKVYILQSGDDIVWVMGFRINDRYKITSQTKNIVRFTLI